MMILFDSQTSLEGLGISRGPSEDRCKLPHAKDDQTANTLASSKAR